MYNTPSNVQFADPIHKPEEYGRKEKIMRTIIKKLFIHFDADIPTIEVEDGLSLDDHYQLSETDIQTEYKDDILKLQQFDTSMEYNLLIAFRMVSEFSLSLGGVNGTDSFTGFDTRIYVDKIDLLDVHAMPSLDDLDI